jgi:signal transduction histidine kinase
MRVGHVYLDVRRRRLHCLNDAARQLHREGVPLTAADLPHQQLQTLDGQPLTADDLPLVIAWRKQAPAEAQFIWSRSQGDEWHLIWTATPLRDTKGQLAGILGSISCSPPEPDLRSMAELAHDLRTPLQSLRLLCSLIERMPQADTELRQALDTVQVAADRAVQVGLELLECCRGPASRKGSGADSWFALMPFLTALAAEQSVVAQGKGLKLTTDFTAVQGYEIRSDRIQLGRVLANLLVNAVRYTPAGHVEFKASWRQEGENRVLALSVVDTGPGIADEEHDSIFQPFERGRAGRDSDSGGSGLGLAVVDRLVNQLGLNLDIYSEYGRGSAFHLLIPETLVRPVTKT